MRVPVEEKPDVSFRHKNDVNERGPLPPPPLDRGSPPCPVTEATTPELMKRATRIWCWWQDWWQRECVASGERERERERERSGGAKGTRRVCRVTRRRLAGDVGAGSGRRGATRGGQVPATADFTCLARPRRWSRASRLRAEAEVEGTGQGEGRHRLCECDVRRFPPLPASAVQCSVLFHCDRD